MKATLCQCGDGRRSAATYHVEVAANEPWPYCLYTCETIANYTKVTVLPTRRQTRVERFKVPARREIHGDFKASGTVLELSGSKWRAAGSATVALYYRSVRSGHWRPAPAPGSLIKGRRS